MNSTEIKVCEQCKFPFIYKGKTYNSCTSQDEIGYWCSTKTSADSVHVKGNWEFCQDYCANGRNK